MDIYTKIAEEFNVDRKDVKTLAFPFLYALNGPSTDEELLECIRASVSNALRFNLIKRKAPNESVSPTAG